MSVETTYPPKISRSSKRRLSLAVNGKFGTARVTGVERYGLSVLRHLVPLAAERGHEVIFIGASDSSVAGDTKIQLTNFTLIPSPVPRSSIWRHLWEQLVLPVQAQLHKADYLLNFANTCPVLFPNNILTLHDVSWLEEPRWFSRSFRALYSVLMPLAVRRARWIVTVSSWSREEIARRLGVQDKVSALLEGVAEEFHPQSPPEVKRVLDKFGIDGSYILHVGTLQPRKNLPALIGAFKKLCQAMERPPYLVLAGGRSGHFADDSIEAEIRDCPFIKQLGYVDDRQLPALYSGALFYTSASVYEGFGLTLLESMACGCPVAASDIEPHREVTNGSALMYNPHDTDEIYQALLKMTVDEKLRYELQQKGHARARQFSWEGHARSLLDIIESVDSSSVSSGASCSVH